MGTAKPAKLKTILKAGRVLDLFTKEKPEWANGAISSALRIPKATTHAILGSLAEAKLLTRTSDGRYKLGWRLAELAEVYLSTSELHTAVDGVLARLWKNLQRSIFLGVIESECVVLLRKLLGLSAAIASKLGNRTLPAHATVVGKALLAYSDEAVVERVLKRRGLIRVTANTIVGEGAFAKELAAVRRRGYSIGREEGFRGLYCVAAPIMDPEGAPVAAIAIVTDKQDLSSNEALLARSVQAAAVEASENLGWRRER